MPATIQTEPYLEVLQDEDPDPSHLEQEGFEDRLAKYRDGDLAFIGVRAVCEININGVIQTITSPGLWGIEDDSGDEYINSVYEEELAQLKDTLRELGVKS